MNKLSPTALAVALAFAGAAPAASAASDADLAEIRRQLQAMQTAYERRIAALEQKLAQAEGSAARAAAAASTATTAAAAAENSARQASLRPPATVPASGFNPEASLILQGQVRKMKDVDNRRIAGFWPTGVDGRRGFSLDETELVLAANVDPYWRGQAIVALIDGEAEVEEAWFQSLGLGNGLGLKVGRLRSGIGYLNEQHPHAQDFADAPLVYQAMFGEGASYAEDGVQLKWVAPTPVFVELGAEVGRGAAFPGSDRNRNGAGGGALFAHLGDDVGASHSWRAGVSYLQTKAGDRGASFADAGGLDDAVAAFAGRSRTWIADFVWKWAPEGNAKYRNFKLQGEYFRRQEAGDLSCANAVQSLGNACDPGSTGAVATSDYRSRQSGWYLQGVYRLAPNWRAGLRHDRLDSGRRDFGANAGKLVVEDFRPQRTTLMADYSWSEFSRLRLQLAQEKAMPGVTDNRVWLQYIMSLGAHGTHKF